MSKPKISFVIPVWNKSAYLAECINSLLCQTLKNIDIVIVNDGSTDSSMELIDFYAKKDDRIEVLNSVTNKGRSLARNMGNCFAKSDIICVQDADDVSYPDRAKKVFDYFKRHPKVDVLYSSFVVCDMFMNPVETIVAMPFDFERVQKTGVTYIGHSTMAYRKKAVLDVGYMDGEYSKLGLDDWKLQMDLYQKGFKFGYIKTPLMKYRQHSDNISRVRDSVKVYQLKGEYFKQLNKDKVYKLNG